MKILGIDIATTTGWSLLDERQLIDYGSLTLHSSMTIQQKLHQLRVEMERILEKCEPDYVFIEDVILAISGAKTLAYLARLNGVVIESCYTRLKQNVHLATPTTWKANSFEGLHGSAKKWQIQYAVLKHFNIPLSFSYEEADSIIDGRKSGLEPIQEEVLRFRSQMDECKKVLNRKRSSDEEKFDAKQQLTKLVVESTKCKAHIKTWQKEFDKKMIQFSNDLTAQSGITPDIADSISLAYYGFNILDAENN